MVKRLAGDGGLIHRGAPFENCAVDGNPLAGPDEDLVSRPQGVGIDALLDAVAPAHGLARAEGADAVDGCASAERTALFEEAAHFEEKRDERGCDKVTGGRSGQDGDGDQLVCGTAGVAGNHSAQAGDERGNAHDGRGQASEELADLPLVGRQTHQERT